MKKRFLFCALISVLFVSCHKTSPSGPVSQILMDTVCTVNAYTDGTDKLYSEIFLRLSELETIFSATKTDSELTLLNKNYFEKPVKISEDLKNVLQLSLQITSLTDKALNPAAKKLIDLWGINTDHYKIPESEELQKTLEFCNPDSIHLSGNLISSEHQGTEIALGAVVKGYACDEIVKILKSHKVKKAVIDLGGNIYVYGKKDDGNPWVCGVKNPEQPGATPLIRIITEETSVVTSGIYERNFTENGKTYHHIFDTNTGYPADNNLYSATIICSSSFIADALSTATFVMGPEKSLAMLPEFESLFACEIGLIFIEKNLEVTASKNLKGKLVYSKEYSTLKPVSYR